MMGDEAGADFAEEVLEPGGLLLSEGAAGFGESVDVIVWFHYLIDIIPISFLQRTIA